MSCSAGKMSQLLRPASVQCTSTRFLKYLHWNYYNVQEPEKIQFRFNDSLYRQRMSKKAWNPKWKVLRSKKLVEVELPDYEKIRKEMKGQLTPDEIRDYMKKEGYAPDRPFNERPILLTTTDTVFEPFLPPEGDGRMSTLTKEGAKQRFEAMEKKGKTLLHLRRLRRFDEEFDTGDFGVKAQDIYIKAHNLLADGKYDDLHDYVTESCYPDMLEGVDLKTVRWKWHETLELPRIMHIRVAPILTKVNYYAQITVRLHGRQSLAVYDRFGRLMYGSENLVKNVLEYVVFEKHLLSQYGKWRVHSKIVPSWSPPRDPVLRTFRKPEIVAPTEAYLEKERKKQEIKEEDLKDENASQDQAPPESIRPATA